MEQNYKIPNLGSYEHSYTRFSTIIDD